MPGPGENFQGSSDAIKKHVEEVVDELGRAARVRPMNGDRAKEG